MTTMELDQLIVFDELNCDKSSSIVLIHGGFSNSTSWNSAVPYLRDFHLLIPDMPGHGRSRKSFAHFSTQSAADQIAKMISNKGKGGKARIVGLSLGSHVALQVITRYPQLVDGDAILTGYNVYPSLSANLAGAVGFVGARIGDLFRGKADTTKSMADGNMQAPMPYSYWKEVLPVICTEAWPAPWPARTLIIVAGNRGGSPVTDRPWSARKLRDIAKVGNEESVAAWNSKIIHDWPAVDSELCAEVILAWIERRKLPEGFVPLDKVDETDVFR